MGDEHVAGERLTWGEQLQALDAAIYAAVAATPTPTFDRALGALSRAADHSKLWMAAASVLVATGGPHGRRAAASGLTSLGVTSAIVNIGLKPLGRRGRPDRAGAAVPVTRHVSMPLSTSFPSGHSASAFAFASGVGASLPVAAMPLRALATLVAYSRVHTGVHYPADVVAGSVLGGAIAPVVVSVLDRRLDARRLPPTLSRRSRRASRRHAAALWDLIGWYALAQGRRSTLIASRWSIAR